MRCSAMYEKELISELEKIWDDYGFTHGTLEWLDSDEQRKKVLDGIKSGELTDAGEIFDFVMLLAGICEDTFEKEDDG